jgi:hypothetical protein
MKIEAAARLKAADSIEKQRREGDKERITQLQTLIKHAEEDVKDIEEDGDDASRERKHLESMREELRKLKGIK